VSGTENTISKYLLGQSLTTNFDLIAENVTLLK